MKKKYIYQKATQIFLFVFAILVQGCKEEFMPAPAGEILPAPEHPATQQALENSGSTLFLAAWKRSNIETFIKANYPENLLTILVPNDNAMHQAGYTAEAIAAAVPADLDSLIGYSVLIGEVYPSQLESSPSAQRYESVLTHNTFLETSSGRNTRPYRYHHMLQITTEGFTDNGVKLKTLEEIPVQHGRIILVDKLINRPSKQMIDILKNDSRFSLFVKALQINGHLYDLGVVDYISPNGFTPYKYLTDWYATTNGMEMFSNYPNKIIRFTLFAPTNTAFNALGIYTEEDIVSLNSRAHYQYRGNNMTPSDSLLINHKIGLASMQSGYNESTWEMGLYTEIDNQAANAVFYSSSLNNALLKNYVIRLYTPDWVEEPEYLGFDFGTDASGRVTIKKEGSTETPATITEENINTIQGPIHVVDRIIVPEGFSMWHK